MLSIQMKKYEIKQIQTKVITSKSLFDSFEASTDLNGKTSSSGFEKLWMQLEKQLLKTTKFSICYLR